MNKAQKQARVVELKTYFSEYANFYVINTESLSVTQMNTLRRACFKEKITFKVAKNTLIQRALHELSVPRPESVDTAFHGVSALLFSENPKTPALIIHTFREANPGEKPQLKVALIEGDAYVGDTQLSVLRTLKTKNELIGEIVNLLQSPTHNVLSALNSGARTLSGLLQTLEKRA